MLYYQLLAGKGRRIVRRKVEAFEKYTKKAENLTRELPGEGSGAATMVLGSD